ncbi:MAG: casein kinase 2 regulatory subunit [Chrysothrix sp. TS-e1954]|nr:MAG: casein kinase 2 regulatory subunit [Chrysothrix sp. TS-e1954]
MSSSSQVIESWISSFCNILGHEYFAEVSEDFIEDDFNLTGLSSQVPMYKEALEMILDVEPEEDEEELEEDALDDEDEEDLDGTTLADEGRNDSRHAAAAERRNQKLQPDINAVEASAELLYGLIHQRYITSRPGIGQMQEKYKHAHFGACPRVHCNGCRVLPVGCSDTPGQNTVKLFCPSCLDVYTPPNSRFQTVDGAFFGTTFGCLFLMTFPDLKIAPPPDTDDTSLATSDISQPQNDRGSAQPKASPSGQQRGQPTPGPEPETNGIIASNFAPGLGRSNIYEPRIYGFRVSERARSGPRMKWLRMKPDDLKDLDEVQRFEALQREEDGEDGDPEDEMIEEDDESYQEEGAALNQDVHMQGQEQQEQSQMVSRRKKAPIRRRKRLYGGNGAGSPDDTGMAEAMNVNGNAGVG